MESSAKSKYDAFTVGMNKRYAQNYQFQWNYTIGRDMSDDDNERDPFTFRYAVANNLAPEYNYSDRDQRHRFNAWFLVTAKGFDFNTRISSRTAQPRSVGETPQDRIQADGSIIKRNTLRKDNEFFTWDFRVGRPFKLTKSVRLEPVFEVFNLTNSKNIRRPVGDQPDLQLRRHRAERAGRSAPGAARGAGAVLISCETPYLLTSCRMPL